MSRPGGAAGSIKAVIFDIGGILEPAFDHVLVPELATMLGIPAERLTRRRTAEAVALSEGRLTLRDLYTRVAAEGGLPVDPAAVVARHLAVYETATARLDSRVLTLIEALRRRHVVACLTHTEGEVGQFNRQRGLFAPFDRAFLSTELGLHKPQRAIFERLLADLGCGPAEAVFTDDKLENADGARAAGMHAIHYRDFEGFTRELAELVGRDA
jgi:putative hydrolase of the HAD superfamily